jgi:hypothetical protein
LHCAHAGKAHNDDLTVTTIFLVAHDSDGSPCPSSCRRAPDEYGSGRARDLHSTLVATTVATLDLDPGLADDLLFGATALMRIEERVTGHLLHAWSMGRSSLLAPTGPDPRRPAPAQNYASSVFTIKRLQGQ